VFIAKKRRIIGAILLFLKAIAMFFKPQNCRFSYKSVFLLIKVPANKLPNKISVNGKVTIKKLNSPLFLTFA
jgi:hypothetical protein